MQYNGGAVRFRRCRSLYPERDAIVRRESLASGKSFTVLSWNVNGIRATAGKGLETLRGLVKEEKPDLVCFQVRTAKQATDRCSRIGSGSIKTEKPRSPPSNGLLWGNSLF